MFIHVIEHSSELLGILYPLTRKTKGYFGPGDKPQICMQWLQMNIPWRTELDDVNLKRFFFCFIGSCLLGNNQSMLTCMMLGAIRVASIIRAYDWGSVSYRFFISYLRQVARQGFRILEGFWQILTWWAYEYIPAM